MTLRPAAGLLLMLWLALLQPEAAYSAGNKITLTHSDGSQLNLQQPARRIITLAPNLAEMVYAAGAGDQMIATVAFSDFPEAVGQLPQVGDAFRFDLEQILSLKPDLIIAWSSGNPAQALARLEELGLTVWRTEMQQPQDIATLLEQVGLATGHDSSAAANQIRHRLGALKDKFQGLSTVRYFYQVAPRPLFTLNGTHIVSRGLEMCGGNNVFADQSVLAPQITRESVLAADPDVLIAPQIDPDQDPLAQWREWPRMLAVQNQAFIYLSANRISRATPRMLDSLEIACNLLHDFRQSQSTDQEKQ